MFFSTKSPWIKYIKNNFFTTWPGLTVELLTEYLPNSILTAKGHLRQSYRLTISTKQYVLMTKPFPEVTGQPPYSTDNGKTYEFPHDHGSKTNNIFLKLYNASEKIYSYQTGRFPITASKVIEYVMIVYEHDSNLTHG